MKIVIAAPLLPPETGASAEYVWELARRLAQIPTYEVTVVAYAHTHVPIPGVRVRTVEKQLPLPARLAAYRRVLTETVAAGADVLFAERAGAAGLPAWLVARAHHIPFVVHFPHDELWERAQKIQHRIIPEFSYTTSHTRTLHTRALAYAQKHTLRHAQCIVVHSHAHARHIARRFTLPRERMLPLPTPAPAPARLPFSIPDNSHRVAALLPPHPGEWHQARLRDTFALLQKHTQLELTVLHHAQDTPVHTDTEALGTRVHAIHNASRAQMRYVMHRARAIVLLHHDVSDPSLLADILSMETRALVPDTPFVREYVPAPPHQYYMVKESETLVTALETMVTHPCAQPRMCILPDVFTWNTHIQTLTKYLNTLV